MPAVFPWGESSRLVAAVLLASLLTGSILLVWLYLRASRLLRKLEDTGPEPRVWRAPRVVARARRLLRWTTGFLAAYGLAYALTWTYAPLGNLFWGPAVDHLPTLLIVGGTLVLASLARESVRHVDDVVERRAKLRGRKVNRQAVRALQLLLDAAILLVATAVVIAGALDVMGYQGDLGAALVAWLAEQAGAIILLVTLAAVGWFGSALIRATTREIRYTTERVSPRVVDAIGAVARGALITVLVIIALVTLLQSLGLGQVGGTLVVVLSSFIGLTVAMAGTGSIGNALSGMVLLAFRPLDKGDRVILVNDLVCDVEDVTLMFTRVRTTAGERVDIPNNQILGGRIRNLSRSGTHAIVVGLGIGYDVDHERVRALAIQAATGSPGIVAQPPPQVFARELANYAITYELYAYTNEPRHLKVKSDLLGRLQHTFAAAGVEILTPDVYVLRRGEAPQGAVRLGVQEPPPPAAPGASERQVR